MAPTRRSYSLRETGGWRPAPRARSRSLRSSQRSTRSHCSGERRNVHKREAIAYVRCIAHHFGSAAGDCWSCTDELVCGLCTDDCRRPPTRPVTSGAPGFPGAAARAGALPGGRVVADGPFLFYATLYHDAQLHLPTQAGAAWLASDVPGVGARLLWLYRGPGTLEQGVAERWGPAGTVSCAGADYPSLRRGQRGGREAGGLVLPRGARPGRRVGYGLVLVSRARRYGVVIRFTAVRGRCGLMVGHVRVAIANRDVCPNA